MRLFICDQPGANDAGRFISLGLEKRGQQKRCKGVGERVQYSKQDMLALGPVTHFFMYLFSSVLLQARKLVMQDAA